MIRFLIFTVLILLSFSMLYSQSAISTGMGGTGIANINGCFSIKHNPAGLIQTKDSSLFQFVVPELNLGQFNNTNLILENFNDSDGHLDNQDKEKILSMLGGPTILNLSAKITYFALSFHGFDKNIGTLAFHVTESFDASITLPDDIIKLGLYGNTPDQVFSADDLAVKVLWYRSYGFSWAAKENKLTMGVSLRYLQGYEYAELEFDNTSLYTLGNHKVEMNCQLAGTVAGPYRFDSDAVTDFGYSLLPDVAGHGAGIDLGVQYDLNDNLKIGAALMDIGFIHWNKRNTENYAMDFEGKIVEITDDDYLDSLFNSAEIEKKETTTLTTSLPARLSIGASYSMNKSLPIGKELLLNVESNIYFTEPISPQKAYLASVGAKWTIDDSFPAIMLGYCYTYGHNSNITAGLAFEYRKADFYLATQNIISAFSKELETSLAFGFGLRF